MAGYTRQDTANNIANGNVIDADDFDAEYNALESAFNASSGHKHDGTAGEGAPITKVGPSQNLIVSATDVLPSSSNVLSLGNLNTQFKNAWFDGTVSTDILTVDETSTFTGTLTANGGVTGNLTGNVTGDVTGDVTGNLTGNVTGNITGSVTGNVTGNITGNVTGDLTGDVTGDVTSTGTSTFSAIDVNGGTIDGTPIGNTTAALITGTTITATSFVGPVTGNVTGNLTGNVTGNLTGNVTGNADTATTLATARTIAGQSFNGSANITIAATDLSDTDQSLATTSDVTFNDLTVSGNLTVSGTTSTVNTETINLADNQIVLNSNETGSPTQNSGIEIERGTATNKTLVWNETDDKWTVGSETFVAGTFEGALTGNVTGDVTGNVTAASSSDLTLSTDEVMVFKSADTSNVGNPVFNFQHTSSANSAKPPQLNIKNTDTATAADQLIGEFRFVAADSLGSYVDYATFKSTILDTTSATRDGSFVMTVSDAGANDLEVFSAGGGQNTVIKAGLDINLRAGVTSMTNSAGTGTLTFTPNSSSQVISAQTDLRLTGTDIRIDATTNVKLEGTTTDVFGDLVLSKGASDWKVTVNGSNELVISYAGVNKMKLDSSGNLTVTGDVTAFGTI